MTVCVVMNLTIGELYSFFIEVSITKNEIKKQVTY